MIKIYYYVVLFNAVVSLLVGVTVLWRNRYRAVGPLFAVAMLWFAVWAVGFAQYFKSMSEAQALWWASLTLTGTILVQPFFFHSMCALVGEMRRFRIWIILVYPAALLFLVLLWHGDLLTGLRYPPYMDHYVHFNRAWYPIFGGYILFANLFGVGILAVYAKRANGYKRTQLVYFIIAWLTAFLTTNSIIMPLEYDIHIQPFGFFVLPLNFAFLAYVLAKSRLMEINLAVAKVVIYVGTMATVMIVTLGIIGLVNQIDPHFLGSTQTLFFVGIMLLMSAVLAYILPRLAPMAEQALQSRFFGDRYRYQQAIADVITQFSTITSSEELLQLVCDRIVEHMQVARACVLMQEDVTTDYTVRARASLQPQNGDAILLAENTETIQWLRQHRRSLVKEEVQQRETPARVEKITEELEGIGVSMCVPMVLDGQLVGTLALENKLSGDMFADRDIRLLERLCGEAALAVRFRKFEQQMVQASKLAALGTLAAGIAHDIRNPLSSIKTFVQLLPTHHGDEQFLAEFAKLASNDVDRIAKIVENVLSFARSTTITVHEQKLEDIIDDALQLIGAKIKRKNVEVTKQMNNIPLVKVDKDQMSQVFVNIILNAVEALPEQGGKIKITASTSILPSPHEGNRRRLPHLTVEIADNGPGIPENVKGRLFDPFFTTKSEGTGLGLSITHKVVELHGGFITVNSTAGQGAAFLVNIPL